MAIRDFGLFCLICTVWGMNMIVSRWVFIATDIEPLFYAGMRFGMIALVLFPLFFRRWPSDLFKLFLISLCIGSAHFGLLFIGLANASASSAAVVGQLAVPFTTLLSILFLNEKVGWRRGLGIVMAFLGVIIISVNPSEFSVSTGLLFVVGSAFCASIGSILMKQITRMQSQFTEGNREKPSTSVSELDAEFLLNHIVRHPQLTTLHASLLLKLLANSGISFPETIPWCREPLRLIAKRFCMEPSCGTCIQQVCHDFVTQMDRHVSRQEMDACSVLSKFMQTLFPYVLSHGAQVRPPERRGEGDARTMPRGGHASARARRDARDPSLGIRRATDGGPSVRACARSACSRRASPSGTASSRARTRATRTR